MSFFARFLGDRKQPEDPLAGFDAEAEEQAEGLFMQPAMPTAAAPAFGPSVAFQGEPAAVPDEPAAFEPAPAEPANILPFPADPEPQTEAAAAAEEVSPEANDILSAFSASHQSGELGELAKEIEDVPVDELVTQLQELREIMRQRTGQ
jgi:hypothetical protein